MPKWRKPIDPTEAAASKAVTELLPVLLTRRDELLASWNGVIPTDYDSVLIRSIIRPALNDHLGTEHTHAKSMADALLHNTLITPLRTAFRRQEIIAEKAAEALVDTTRPVIKTCISSSKERIGSLAIIHDIRDSMHERDQVLVCIDCGYVGGNDDDERDGGWYTNYAEPNDAEKATAQYRELTAQVAIDRAREQQSKKLMDDRRQADLAAIRAEGREPTFFEDLFAGTSDN